MQRIKSDQFVFRWAVRGGGWSDSSPPRREPIGVSGSPLQYLTPPRSKKAAKLACRAKRYSRDRSRAAMRNLQQGSRQGLR